MTQSKLDPDFSDPYQRYSVKTQNRIRQAGTHKGEEYKTYKFYDNKTKKFVNHAQVIRDAKITLPPNYSGRTKWLPKQKQPRKITHTFKVIGYIRKTNSDWGAAGTVADSDGDDYMVHYRVETNDDLKRDTDMFEYQRDAGGNAVEYDYTHTKDGRLRYDNAELEFVRTEFF